MRAGPGMGAHGAEKRPFRTLDATRLDMKSSRWTGGLGHLAMRGQAEKTRLALCPLIVSALAPGPSDESCISHYSRLSETEAHS